MVVIESTECMCANYQLYRPPCPLASRLLKWSRTSSEVIANIVPRYTYHGSCLDTPTKAKRWSRTSLPSWCGYHGSDPPSPATKGTSRWNRKYNAKKQILDRCA